MSLSTKTQTQIHMVFFFFLLCSTRIFGRLAPSLKFQLLPPNLGALYIRETQAAAPLGEHAPQLPASLQRKLPLCAQPSPPGPANENSLEKQRDACNSLFGVSENKIHLSSPDDSHRFQMILEEEPFSALNLEGWLRFRDCVFMDVKNFMRNTIAGSLISIGFLPPANSSSWALLPDVCETYLIRFSRDGALASTFARFTGDSDA